MSERLLHNLSLYRLKRAALPLPKGAKKKNAPSQALALSVAPRMRLCKGKTK
jgi:hypothetical protein